MNKTIINILTVIVFLMVSQLHAKDGLNGSAGIKLIYSKDEDILQNYYKPFISAGWNDDVFEIKGSYYRWISYTVTDELLNTKEINLHQPELELSFYPGDLVNIDLGYSFYSGDSSFTGYRISSGLLFDFEKTDLSFDYSYKKNKYDFDGEIQKLSQNASAELSLDLTDSLSFDIDYGYDRIDYKTYGYIYNKHSLRGGVLYIFSRNLFLITGIAGSIDSADIAAAMIDAGFTLKLYDHIKIGAIYMFTAEFSENSDGGSGSGTKTKSSIETNIIHTGSISVSLYF